MDCQSSPWRRKKSSEMNPRETESSGSVSSSETFSDELEISRTSAVNSSLNYTQSKDDSSTNTAVGVDETTKRLTEKLSAALVSICAKEDLVKQHAKVAEEALLGWEKSDKEIASMKQQLKAAILKNSSLEERLGHLDDALKECVRQLRQSREEQEEKVHDAISKKTREWESHKSELETQFIELQAKLDAKTEAHTSFNHEICSKVEILEKENASLKVELIALTEDLQKRTLEMELSVSTAETASKQHLESIKKVAKLEAECRSLRARTHKPSLPNDHRFISNSLYGESLTDSQSDTAERLFGLDNELSIPDSWASALIAELDQFKNEKTSARNLTNPVEIDLMDDFLEMERLASLTEGDYGSSSFEHEADLDVAIPRQSSPRNDGQTLRQQLAVLEKTIEKMTSEKGEMESSLAKTNIQLKISQDQLVLAEGELVELHRKLDLVIEEKHTLEVELEIIEANRKKMKLELEAAHKEIGELKYRINLLKGGVEDNKPLSAKLTSKCQNMEAVDSETKELKTELESAYMEIAKSSECTYKCQNMDSLETRKKELEAEVESATLEISKLHKKSDPTEKKVEENLFSAQILANCPSMEAMDVKRTQAEYQINLEILEVHKLQEKVDILEAEVEEGTSLSAEFESDMESLEAKKLELVVQLELEQMEVRNLQEKLNILEKQIENEKRSTAEFAARCHALENELSTKKQAEIQQCANSNASLKFRQEREVTQATGRLAKCQKTIASLNLQLKSLATLDDFLLEAATPKSSGETVEHKGEPKILDFSDSPEEIGGALALCNGTQRLSLSECPEIFSPSRSNNIIQNQI